MRSAQLALDCGCVLGEGPLWHPGREELFWFDISRHTLFAARLDQATPRQWIFPDAVTAAAIVDDERLLIAAADGLVLFDIASGHHSYHVGLESERPGNRSNDGRVHPSGTFWISTMQRDAAAGGGAVHAYRHGRVVTLFSGLTIPNTICFSPDGTLAYFTDTPTGRIMRCAVDPQTGLPASDPDLFVDTSAMDGAPDGAVVDSAGYLWNARYSGGCVLRFAPDGRLDGRVAVPADNPTCPALAGPARDTLVVTTASEGAPAPAGGLFAVTVPVPGQAEPAVAL